MFDDIEFWVGSGDKRAAIVIDWVENDSLPPALAWGYRWDGAATGRDMLLAVITADARLFAKLGNTPDDPVRLYGLGYDVDGDGEFGACSVIGDEVECTQFDDSGFAYSGEIYVSATATDPGDLYREGWAIGTGFWHYGVASSNPFNGGNWTSAPEGMDSRTLTDGAWDSWAFSSSTSPPFTAYAENSLAALPPPPVPGDYNGDRTVDADDYAAWKTAFGFVGTHAADGNGNGIVDAADYTIWRHHASAAANLIVAPTYAVPEPAAWALLLSACFEFCSTAFRRRKERIR